MTSKAIDAYVMVYPGRCYSAYLGSNSKNIELFRNTINFSEYPKVAEQAYEKIIEYAAQNIL